MPGILEKNEKVYAHPTRIELVILDFTFVHLFQFAALEEKLSQLFASVGVHLGIFVLFLRLY